MLGDVGGPEIDVLHLAGKIFVDAVSQAHTPGQAAVVHVDLIRLDVNNAERIADVDAGTLRILIAHSHRRGHIEARLGGTGTGCREAQDTAETLKFHDLRFIGWFFLGYPMQICHDFKNRDSTNVPLRRAGGAMC